MWDCLGPHRQRRVGREGPELAWRRGFGRRERHDGRDLFLFADVQSWPGKGPKDLDTCPCHHPAIKLACLIKTT